MADEQQALASKLWDALEDSPFVMLGLKGRGFTRPMTAQIDGEHRIYFFASRSEDLVQKLGPSGDALATYASKGHDLFASMNGILRIETDRAKVDELWSPMVAAWFDGGKDDPDLALLRFDADSADVWEASTTSALKAAFVKLTGGDPADSLSEDRAEVAL